MQESRARSAGKQTGMLAALTIAVAGLTLLFNLIGALCVSVISGMMAGASRRWKWQIVLVSLVPPLVILLLGRVTKVGLDSHQRTLVALVCFGAFWATYLVTLLAMRFESTSQPLPDQPASRQSTSREESDALPRPAAAVASESKDQLTLDHFQGTWLCETSFPDEFARKKVFVVAQDKFSLNSVNAHGNTRLIAHGDVIVQDTAVGRRLVLSGTAADTSDPMI